MKFLSYGYSGKPGFFPKPPCRLLKGHRRRIHPVFQHTVGEPGLDIGFDQQSGKSQCLSSQHDRSRGISPQANDNGGGECPDHSTRGEQASRNLKEGKRRPEQSHTLESPNVEGLKSETQGRHNIFAHTFSSTHKEKFNARFLLLQFPGQCHRHENMSPGPASGEKDPLNHGSHFSGWCGPEHDWRYSTKSRQRSSL